ncbi:MAG: class I SAM-dependent methyltransferase [Pyrinomonadaceae bacterium]
MERKEHWENVYATKSQDQMSWYRDHLDNSLKLIIQTGVGKDAAIIDVGGGCSTLVDDLLDGGFADVSVLDISGAAIEKSKERLGASAQMVNWIVADITEADLPDDRFDVWHDRAVFHFLTDVDDRRKYVDLVMRALKPGGHLIVASFGLEGPQKCSGLDVVRYSPETMHGEFGQQFTIVKSLDETHNTPFGTTQEFVYCYFKKLA